LRSYRSADETASVLAATSLIDPTKFDSQLNTGLSLAAVTELFRAYAAGKVDSFGNTWATSATLGGTSTPNVNVSSDEPNEHTPMAVDDMSAGNDRSWDVTAGTTLTKNATNGVLSNDTATDGYTLTALLVSQPKYGSVTLGADGSLSYTPYQGITGTDTFTYLASDGHGGTKLATVVLTITPS
jgi:hypothetical protein